MGRPSMLNCKKKLPISQGGNVAGQARTSFYLPGSGRWEALHRKGEGTDEDATSVDYLIIRAHTRERVKEATWPNLEKQKERAKMRATRLRDYDWDPEDQIWKLRSKTRQGKD